MTDSIVRLTFIWQDQILDDRISLARYMVHLKNVSYSAREATELLKMASDIVPEGVIVRDVRVSKKYVEFDISIPELIRIESILKSLEDISPIAEYEQVVDRQMAKEEAISRAIRLFNDEKYWGAHESLEQVWKKSSGNEKALLNGIILIAAAFVHDEKGEHDVCLSILSRAAAKLAVSSGQYYGIDIDLIKSQVQNILQSGTIVRFSV